MHTLSIIFISCSKNRLIKSTTNKANSIISSDSSNSDYKQNDNADESVSKSKQVILTLIQTLM